jgi:hypothetical protein
MSPFEFMHIQIEGVTNPGQTEPTNSFKVTISDSSDQELEFVVSGVTFTATAGLFASIALSAVDPYISK